MGGDKVKIDKRILHKIGIVLALLGFLSIVETAISKTVSPKITTEATQSSFVPSFAKSSGGHGETTADRPLQPIQPVKNKLSLEQIHALSQGQDKEITRALRIVPAEQLQSDKFTQSQAHMSLPEIKKLIDAKYNIKPYQNMIDAILDREKQYKDNYYVFYHGMNNLWYVPQDLYTRLYFHFKKLPADLLQSFVFLRFDGVPAYSGNVQDFLLKKLKENGLVNDHDLVDLLYSVNIALFGSVGDDPECTWQYFMQARKKVEPDRQTYEKILDIFGLPHTYVNELMQLTKLFSTKEETIVQIFVPQDKVDQIGYVAWIRGNPAHKKTMDMVLGSLQDKKFAKSPLAMDYYTGLFKREQESNPIFSDLLERIKAGDFTLSYFLKFYRNYPELIEDINRYQARLIFTPDVLLNPLSGVKVFRYSTATAEQLKKYHQKFDEVFQKIVSPAA
jgi:hypothetical protein